MTVPVSPAPQSTSATSCPDTAHPTTPLPTTASFDAVGGVSPEANNEAVAALTGLASPDDLLMAEWRNSPYRPCHYVAIDRANQCIVLSIRWGVKGSTHAETGRRPSCNMRRACTAVEPATPAADTTPIPVPCLCALARGSLQLGDLLSDLAAAPMEVTVGGVPGYVHQARTRWDVGWHRACCTSPRARIPLPLTPVAPTPTSLPPPCLPATPMLRES